MNLSWTLTLVKLVSSSQAPEDALHVSSDISKLFQSSSTAAKEMTVGGREKTELRGRVFIEVDRKGKNKNTIDFIKTTSKEHKHSLAFKYFSIPHAIYENKLKMVP